MQVIKGSFRAANIWEGNGVFDLYIQGPVVCFFHGRDLSAMWDSQLRRSDQKNEWNGMDPVSGFKYRILRDSGGGGT